MPKSFKVKDLMINLSPQPLCLCGTQALTGTGPCLCNTHLGITCHNLTHPCFCNSNVHISITVCYCGSQHGTFTPPCACATRIVSCICASNAEVSICGTSCAFSCGITPINTCTPLASQPTGPIDIGDPAQGVEQLGALKEQLKQALEQVEQQHQAAQDALRPQTVAEVDELQKKMADAMEELKARRAELERKEKDKK